MIYPKFNLGCKHGDGCNKLHQSVPTTSSMIVATAENSKQSSDQGCLSSKQCQKEEYNIEIA